MSSSSNETSASGAPPIGAGDAGADAAATLAAWRARGAHAFDPVRFGFAEAMARRTAVRSGAARRILDAKLAALLAAYGEDLARAGTERNSDDNGNVERHSAAPQAASVRGPLAALLDHMAAHAPADRATGVADEGGELKTLSYFRSTWARLGAQRRLTQSLAAMPENAGPLNSHQLVHRALLLMRDLSPEYLNRFIAYADALLWLEQVKNGAGAAAVTGNEAPRAERPKKKGARGSSRSSG